MVIYIVLILPMEKQIGVASQAVAGTASSPVIGNNGQIYIGCQNGTLYCFDTTANGAFVWSRATGGALDYSSPAIGSDGKIYFGSDDKYLYCLNPDGTGSVNWQRPTGNAINGFPVIGSDGKIYIGSQDKYFYCFNPDGTTNWKAATGGVIRYATPTIDGNGRIYTGSDDKYLYCFSVPPATPQWLNAMPVATNQINLAWNSISFATSYTLFRNTANTTNGLIKVGGVPVPTTNYNDTGLLPGTTYYYWLKAYNNFEGSAYSPVIASSTIPHSPQWLSAIPAATNQINLLWHYLSGATSYTLFRNIINNSNSAQKKQGLLLT